MTPSIEQLPVKVAVNLLEKRPGGFIHTDDDGLASFPPNSVTEVYCDWSNYSPLPSDAISYLTRYLRILKIDGRLDLLLSPNLFTEEALFQKLDELGYENVQRLPLTQFCVLAWKYRSKE